MRQLKDTLKHFLTGLYDVEIQLPEHLRIIQEKIEQGSILRKDIAKVLNVHPSTVTNILNGKRKNVRPQEIEKICTIVGC